MTLADAATAARLESRPLQRKRPATHRPAPLIGLLEWFRPGEYERVEQVLTDIRSLRVTELRTGLSWADWHTPGGAEWYDWLLPRLAAEVNVLPCLVYTPPSL